MAFALSVRNLKKIYANGVHALNGVTLAIEEGDFFALLGPNGAGKTTLIGIVVGLVNKTSGTAQVFDADIDIDHDRAKSYIGLVPQEMNFNIFEKVIDIVVNQAGYYGIPRGEAMERAETYLKQLGLWEKRNDKSQTLSGGMKRRLMIARALIHRPRFLILDEPTAGVDIELRRGMWDFLKELSKEKVTIILTTHYLEEAEQLCKNVAIINKGDIIEQGSMRSVLSKLQAETFIFYLKEPISSETLAHFRTHKTQVMDPTTLEVTIENGNTLNAFILELTRNHIEVVSMRNKSNRLEEVFVNLISQTP